MSDLQTHLPSKSSGPRETQDQHLLTTTDEDRDGSLGTVQAQKSRLLAEIKDLLKMKEDLTREVDTMRQSLAYLKDESATRRGNKSKMASECAHTDRPHYSSGLCQNCYLAQYYKKRKEKAIRKEKEKNEARDRSE